MNAPYNCNLIFFVNGKKIIDKNVDPETTLLSYLRNKLRLCGTKMGCNEGGCGACTVMISKYHPKTDKTTHLAINACLAPICSMHGLAVTTVEGIGSTNTKLHAVQERIAKNHGSQCGFCTPGFVMSMYVLLRNQPRPSMEDLEKTFQGNLCRCTGYRPIMDGYKTFIETNGGNFQCPMGKNCCKNNKKNEENSVDSSLINGSEFKPDHSTQEPIFPPELKLSTDILDDQNLIFTGPRVTWYRPTNFENLLELKHIHPDAKLVVGNTEIGVEVKFKNQFYPLLITPSKIVEMNRIDYVQNGLRVGCSVTLQNLENFLLKEIQSQAEYKTKIFKAIIKSLHVFAGKQIRSVASVGGNIMTGSPTSDLNPIFMASNVELEVGSKSKGVKQILLDENFFTGYRRNVLEKDQVLISLIIPYTSQNQYFYFFKQSRRKEDDMAIVNFAINLRLDQKSSKIEEIRMSFGGMEATTICPINTCKTLIGKTWNEDILHKTLDLLVKDLPLSASSPGGMPLYRQSLVLGLFFKAFLKINSELGRNVNEKDLSAIRDFQLEDHPKSSQYFRKISNVSENDTVGKPVMHASALQQATGEAIYCNDIPHYKNQLYMGLILSSKSHAKIISIDPTPALNLPQVRAFFSAKDIKEENNRTGFYVKDEEVFVSKTCTSQGQILGVVIGEDEEIARRAAKLVKVEYEELFPIIVTTEDAIKYDSYLPGSRLEMNRGDVDEVFKSCKHIVEGEIKCGAQEHFYLEPISVVVVPKTEENEIEIYSTTQAPTDVSVSVSQMLNIPQNRVISKVKRMGGSFGGKETRPTAVVLPAAFAAKKLGQPVRCSLERTEDILLKGTRNPFLMKYKAGVDEDGKILAIDFKLYINAGRSFDLSRFVLERATLQFFSTYKFGNIRYSGICCKTNLQTCTAFRGFGSPQIMLATENLIRDVADVVNKDVIQVMKLNLFQEGDVTFYNFKVDNSNLDKCFEECLRKSCYYQRRKEIEHFNKKNRWQKRGIAIVPLLYGIGLPVAFANIGAALVHIYTDGSVLLSHGGTEMGQGLHTKMIQIASKVLDVPISNIFISETSTDKVPNSMPTNASLGSDHNGPAVMIACQKLKDRLEPYKKNNLDGKWEDWIQAAYFDRVNLSATGIYKTPNIGYDINKNEGLPFSYFVFGTGCTEVVIDTLTGHHKILRTDIVMDLGESLNPAIDVGQIEGGFVQGCGFYTLEEMVYSPKAEIRTLGPSTYKIPGFHDIPLEFNVSILEGVGNPKAVYSSKAVGEPPLCLSVSVFFAIKEAIKAARKDVGASTNFNFNAPATAEKIRIFCEDEIISKIPKQCDDSSTPWNVIP